MSRTRWFAIGQQLASRARVALTLLSFLLPLIAWSLVSYVPWIWHPLIRVGSPGDVAWFKQGLLVDRAVFAEENSKVAAAGGRLSEGVRANPIFLPAPHAVAKAFYTAFHTPPILRDELWLHQSLALSIKTIFLGFAISSVVGVPLGILCGAYTPVSRLAEPVIDFVRYMPAPAFGALAVAVLGIYDAPKIAIIVIGTFFQQVLKRDLRGSKMHVSNNSNEFSVHLFGERIIFVKSSQPCLYMSHGDLPVKSGKAGRERC